MFFIRKIKNLSRKYYSKAILIAISSLFVALFLLHRTYTVVFVRFKVQEPT